MEKEYLQSIIKQFQYYKQVGERTFAQLEDQDLFWQYNEESNSIAIIVNHLYGNMLSRWTDFLTTDGEKRWRNRDQEFEKIIDSRKELLEKWDTGWDCLFTALNNINQDNFNKKVLIRNEPHSIMEAVNRQFAHYSYHIGQIVYIGRMIKGSEWKSLTIPKGESAAFNKQKFSEHK